MNNACQCGMCSSKGRGVIQQETPSGLSGSVNQISELERRDYGAIDPIRLARIGE